jgi:predicted nucleic acid-binding protein
MLRSRVSAAVVDTSAWIDYFAGRDIPLLDAALKQGIIILPPIVVAELVSGAHKRREREAMIEFLDELPIHETPRDHWMRVGELRLQCREKGLSVSTPDAHVAQCALDLDALLFALDDVFSKIARHTGLRLAL